MSSTTKCKPNMNGDVAVLSIQYIKYALIFVFSMLVGCANLPSEQTINPNALPAEKLATVIGYKDWHSIKSRITNVINADGEELFEREQRLNKIMLEPGKYILNTHCQTARGAYAKPNILVNLKANKTYRVECGYCIAKGQKKWWHFMGSGRPRMISVVDMVPVLDVTKASFDEILNAAKFGYGKARVALANAYLNGTNNSSSDNSHNRLHEAYAWAYLANAQREPGAKVLLAKISEEIEDLEAAESLANTYVLRYWTPQSSACGKPMHSEDSLSENLEARTESRKTKIVIFSEDVRFPVEIMVGDTFVKNLLFNEYVEIFLSPGNHDLHLGVWADAISNTTDSYDIKVGSEPMIIKLTASFFFLKTKYEVIDELPADFSEKYIRAKM